MSDDIPKRVPVDFRYDALNPTFLKMSIDLGGAVIEKFNEVSGRIGVNLTIASDGKSYHHPTSDLQVSKGDPLRPYCPACGSGSGKHANTPPDPECIKVDAERKTLFEAWKSHRPETDDFR